MIYIYTYILDQILLALIMGLLGLMELHNLRVPAL